MDGVRLALYVTSWMNLGLRGRSVWGTCSTRTRVWIPWAEKRLIWIEDFLIMKGL